MPILDLKKAISPAKNIWQYMLGVFALSSLTIPFLWNGPYDSWKFTAIAFTWSFAIWFTQFFGHTLVFQLLDHYFSWRKQPLLRGGVGIVSMIVYASIAFIGVKVLMELIFFQEWPNETLWQLIYDSRIAIMIAAVSSVLATLIGFLNAWRKSELEKEKVKTEMMVYKYNALQEQINPHFLFNSFNVLSELVYEDQDLAVKFIRQMSDLYRYVLATKNEDVVPLKQEVEFIKSFIFLLETRFEKRVQFQVALEPNEGEFIVPMALQILVENAVKHNEATSAKPLLVTIGRKGESILVTNTLQPKAQQENSTQTGLKNLKERYAHLEHEIEVEQTMDEFRVELPILSVEST